MRYVAGIGALLFFAAFLATAVHRHQVLRFNPRDEAPPLRWDFLALSLLCAALLLFGTLE